MGTNHRIARIRCVPQRSEERTNTMQPGAGRDFVAARPCNRGLVATSSLLAHATGGWSRLRRSPMRPGAQRKPRSFRRLGRAIGSEPVAEAKKRKRGVAAEHATPGGVLLLLHTQYPTGTHLHPLPPAWGHTQIGTLKGSRHGC